MKKMILISALSGLFLSACADDNENSFNDLVKETEAQNREIAIEKEHEVTEK